MSLKKIANMKTMKKEYLYDVLFHSMYGRDEYRSIFLCRDTLDVDYNVHHQEIHQIIPRYMSRTGEEMGLSIPWKWDVREFKDKHTEIYELGPKEDYPEYFL